MDAYQEARDAILKLIEATDDEDACDLHIANAQKHLEDSIDVLVVHTGQRIKRQFVVHVKEMKDRATVSGTKNAYIKLLRWLGGAALLICVVGCASPRDRVVGVYECGDGLCEVRDRR